MKDIKIIVDGPTGRDVKLVEIDGHDITGMVRELRFRAGMHDANRVDLELIGNIHLEIIDPMAEYKEMQDK